MKIANGVEMLELTSNIQGSERTVCPTLIWDQETVILSDTGFPGQWPQLLEAFEKAGVEFGRLNMILLTHQDIDHVGGLEAILNELPRVAVYSHGEEKPYIEGEKTPVKLAALEARLDSLTEPMKQMYETMKAGFRNNRARVERALADGEELPYCGGIEVIYTPGHTPGHICLYLKQSRTLVAGDLLNVRNGALMRADPSINYDTDMSIRSLGKLAKYDIENVICYHGGLYRGNANERIAELAEGR